MSKLYILNDSIEFNPEKHQLTAYQNPEMHQILNVPASLCLQLLLERRYELIPHNEFYPYVWGNDGASVSAATLYQNIALLRKALKTFSANGDLIVQTVPRQGFSLAGNVAVDVIEESDKPVTEFVPVNPESDLVPAEQNSGSTGVMETEPGSSDFFEKVPRENKFKVIVMCSSMAVFLLLGVLVFQLSEWGWPSPSERLFTSRVTVGGCQVYTNHAFSRSDLQNSIEHNNVDCQRTPFVYLYVASLQYKIHTSVMLCKKPIENTEPFNCLTYNYLGV